MLAAQEITIRFSFTIIKPPAALPADRSDAERRALRELDDALTEALMESFPASDPVSSLRLA